MPLRMREIAGRTSRGGVLFEVMLALALFVGSAAFTLASVRNVTRTLERSRLQLDAVDLARSKMAELEAGLTTLSGLRGETDNTAASDRSASEIDDGRPAPWRIEVTSSRSEFANLSLVELTIIENISPEEENAGATPMRYTLRQLVALREDAGEPFEQDPMLEGGP